tara:strand:+ start:224 stop:766 length:543 start_codon:yes stop_codon:yes gene_type:complete
MASASAINKYTQLIIAILLLLTVSSLSARGIYQTNENFILEVFTNTPPENSSIILSGDVREKVSTILGHPYGGLIIKYWEKEGRTAWILEEIGKTEPITFGIVIKNNKIEKIKVLAFRESRGWEVRYPAFTKQFNGVGLDNDKLDKRIDGISGATLSFWAMTGVSRVALFLHQHLSEISK